MCVSVDQQLSEIASMRGRFFFFQFTVETFQEIQFYSNQFSSTKFVYLPSASELAGFLLDSDRKSLVELYMYSVVLDVLGGGINEGKPGNEATLFFRVPAATSCKSENGAVQSNDRILLSDLIGSYSRSSCNWNL